MMIRRIKQVFPGFAATVLCWCLPGSGALGRAPLAAYPAPPQVLFGELFVAVQAAHIFADGKAFVDAVPKSAPAQILALYRAKPPATPEALRHFVEANFSMPLPAAAAPSPPRQVAIGEHIDGLWDQLTRKTSTAPPHSSLLPLPLPYVVPGGRFREIYYWDSYFTMLGLAESSRRDLLEGMIGDFAYLIDTFGHIPNGARTYYLSRSQPPFFFAMVALLDPQDESRVFAEYLPQLKAEYAYWMDGAATLKPGTAHRHVLALPHGEILNRYWDDSNLPRDESYGEDTELARAAHRPAPALYHDIRAAAESGWDFSSRWFADGRTRATLMTTELAPIDLNSLLFGLENAIHAGCERRRDARCARDFERRAAARHAAIDRYLWDPAAGAYFDYRWTHAERITRLSAAALYPLFVGLSTADQAAAVGRAVARDLLKPGGIVTTPLATSQQWDAPNGWAPLQWIAVDGLRRYHQDALAGTIACRWMTGVNDVYRKTGKLVEKYDVVDIGRKGGGGEYPTQDGFGWTNGVMRKLMALYPADADRDSTSACVAPAAMSH